MSLPAWAAYVGTVRHRRRRDVAHAFRVPVLYWMLDPERPQDFLRARPWWARGRFGLAHFRRADYLGPAARPLGEAVRDRVEQELGFRPRGPLRMVTQLRCLGYVFNPVSFYYCLSGDGARVEALVAEITNTPWGERHAYVLDGRGAEAGRPGVPRGGLRARFAKDFHVSPFLPMEQDHDWRFTAPGERVAVHMVNHEPGARGGAGGFDATLVMRRLPLTRGALAGALLRRPLMPWRIHLAIYWQALRLWCKRAPFHTHPDKRDVQQAPHST